MKYSGTRQLFLVFFLVTFASFGMVWPASFAGVAGAFESPVSADQEEGGGAIFRSTDSGQSWQRVAEGVAVGWPRSIVIDPSNGTIYAGTYGTGVFKSTDRGNSWSASNSGLTDKLVYDLKMDPAHPSTLYLGTGHEGAFKSTDAGNHWSPASVGLPVTVAFFPDQIWVQKLAIDPQTPSTLYGSVLSSGIFKSTDAGGTWRAVSAPQTDRGSTVPSFASIVVAAVNPTIIYASNGDGVFRSSDGGETWKRSAQLDTYLGSLAVDPRSPETLYGGGLNGQVYKSVDGGQNWEVSGTGLVEGIVFGLAVEQDNPSVLYAGLSEIGPSGLASTRPPGAVAWGGGVCRSTDGGATWAVSITGLSSLRVMSLTLDPTDPRVLFVGTEYVPGYVRPVITAVTREGKKLLIEGENFDPGAELFLNGEAQKTLNDQSRPDSLLIAKKAGKHVKRGDTVTLEVLNPAGRRSDAFTFVRTD